MRPEWISGYPRYDELIKSFGYEYVSEEFGDYQGDIAVVFREGNRKGYLIFGYGSCSGCDALEACTPYCHHTEEQECDCDWSDVIDLRDRMLTYITWDEPLPDFKDENHWWSYEAEMYEWVKENYEKE
jgi:hypothetical protein